MKNLIEHNKMMQSRINDWMKFKKLNRLKRAYVETYANVTCPKCDEELFFTGKYVHRVGPFYEYEVECKKHGIQGVKCIEYLLDDMIEYIDPPKEYKLNKEEYETLKQKFKALIDWKEKEQPKEAGGFHLSVIKTSVGKLNISLSDNGLLIFNVNNRKYFLSKKTKDKIKKIFLAAGGQIKEIGNYKEANELLFIKIDGDITALRQLGEIYNKGCQSEGTYKDKKGNKMKHKKGSVFCRCDWLEKAEEKIILPDGWEV